MTKGRELEKQDQDTKRDGKPKPNNTPREPTSLFDVVVMWAGQTLTQEQLFQSVGGVLAM